MLGIVVPIAGVIALELVAHLACRLFLDDAGYQRMHVWLKESIGTGILLGTVSVWAVVTTPDWIQLLAALWGAAVGTGLALGAAHWLYSWLRLARMAAESAAIAQALRQSGTRPS